MIGTKLAHYEITSHLGTGGMGEVYQATDSKLGRSVAIKLLPEAFTHDHDRAARFEREARVLASLNHPNIATIHGVEESGGRKFLVMELVPGETLAEMINHGAIPLDESLGIATQITEALEAAHEKGVIHRDLKPANIKVTPEGKVKVLDFGLAKAFAGEAVNASLSNSPTMSLAATQQGMILGTAAYMSPEQVEGKELDARSDLFSFGVVLYQMLCGRRPFSGESQMALFASILREDPEHPRQFQPAISAELERIVLRCLEKKAEARYGSANEVHRDLAALQAAPLVRGINLPRPLTAVAALLILIVGGFFGVRAYQQYTGRHWAEQEALPEVVRLMASSRSLEALDTLQRAERFIPASAQLARLKENLFLKPLAIQTEPPGADIYVRDYSDKDKDASHWRLLGKSPLNTSQMPRGYYRLRAIKDGFETVEVARGVAGTEQQTISLTLHTVAETPPGMIWVGAITTLNRGTASVFPAVLDEKGPGFWLDKSEVTNSAFQKFVNAGGYQKPEYWKQPFVKGGRPLSFGQAIAEFRDATGKPGPATWELGTFPEGKGDLPVGGVSWYEAAAYAEFAGKSLPTVYHWFRAAAIGGNPDILKVSNFSGKGASPAGSYDGLGVFGTLDMAGNVKEWALNAVDDRRYILGGGWNDPDFLFARPDAKRPFDRQPTFGFRLSKYVEEPAPDFLGSVPFTDRDRRNDKPVDDQTFQIYKALHAYDKTDDLKPKSESSSASAYWHLEKISFQAAYGNERVVAYLYLPKNAKPPYQVVIFFGGTNVLAMPVLDDEFASQNFGFVVRSGRAVLAPAFKGTLDRGPGVYYHQIGQPDRWREMNLQWSKDLGRSIDYLKTRQDLDADKLGFLGQSMGSAMSPRLLAVEPRIKVAVLFLGGSFEKVSPEVDSWNFASRVKIPVLMQNGKDDFLFPLETSQIPLFKLLSTPEKDKKHIPYEGGHGWNTGTRLDVVKDALDWLDTYLGPVKIK